MKPADGSQPAHTPRPHVRGSGGSEWTRGPRGVAFLSPHRARVKRSKTRSASGVRARIILISILVVILILLFVFLIVFFVFLFVAVLVAPPGEHRGRGSASARWVPLALVSVRSAAVRRLPLSTALRRARWTEPVTLGHAPEPDAEGVGGATAAAITEEELVFAVPPMASEAG